MQPSEAKPSKPNQPRSQSKTIATRCINVTARAILMKKGKNIATVRGELLNKDGKLVTTLVHTVFLIDRENRF